MGDLRHPPAVSSGAFSSPLGSASRQVSTGSGCSSPSSFLFDLRVAVSLTSMALTNTIPEDILLPWEQTPFPHGHGQGAPLSNWEDALEACSGRREIMAQAELAVP